MDEAVLLQVIGDGSGALIVLDEIDIALSDLEARVMAFTGSLGELDAMTETLASVGGAAQDAALGATALDDAGAAMAGTMAEAGAAVDATAGSTQGLSDAMWYLAGAVNNVTTMLAGNTAGLAANTAALDANAASAAAAGAASAGAATKAAAAQTGFLGAVVAGGSKLRMIGLGIAAAGVAFTYFGAQAEDALNIVAALTGASASQMQYYTTTAEQMAQKYGYSLKATADGLYYVVSANFAGADATKVLDAAMQAASAGGANLADVSDGLTSALNAYGANASEATHYTDIMIAAVTNGKQTFQDFASNVSTFAIAGHAAGISFQQMAAAEATLTQSEPAAIAATQLRFLLNSIQDAGKVGKEAAALGVQGFDQAKFASMNLIDKLVYLQNITGGNVTNFNKLVGGIRGTAAAHTLLTQRVDANGKKYYEFNVINSKMNNSAGATAQAFKVHTETLKYSMDQLGATLSVVAYHFEQMIKPALKGLIDGVTHAVQWLGHHAEVATPLLAALGVVLGVVLVAALAKVAIATWAAVAPLLPFIAIAVAAGAALFGLAKAFEFVTSHGEQIKHFFGGIGSAIGGFLGGIGSAVGGAFGGIGSAVGTGLGDIGSAVGGFFDGVGTTVHDGLTGIQHVVGGVFGAIGDFFPWLYNHNRYVEALVNGIRTKFTQAKTFVSGTVATLQHVLAAAWQGIQTVAATAWRMIYTIIVRPVQDAWGFVTGKINDLKTWLDGRWNDITTAAGNIWGNIVTGIRNALSTITTAVHDNIVKPISDAIGGVVAKALDWGKHLVQNIGEGIKGALGGLKDAVGSVFSTIGNALGFHSPPPDHPEAAHWGPNAIKLLAGGMLSALPTLAAASAKAFGALALGMAGGGTLGPHWSGLGGSGGLGTVGRLSAGALPTRIGGVPVAGGAGGLAGTTLGGLGGPGGQANQLLGQMVDLLGKLVERPHGGSGGGGTTTVGDLNQTFNGPGAGAVAQIVKQTIRQRNDQLNRATRGGGGYSTRGNLGGRL